MSLNTPLRIELIEWCGYRYLPNKNLYYREHSVINIRLYPAEGNEKHDRWYAYHGHNHYLCQIESLAQLTNLILAIEGDGWPLSFDYKKTIY